MALAKGTRISTKTGKITAPAATKATPTKSTSKSPSGIPAYNAATGATTGKPSQEYNDYLKSLNKKGSANYVPTPDDPGYVPTGPEKMDGEVSPTTAPNQAQITPPNQMVPYEQAQANLAKGGLAGADLQSAQTALASKYQQAHTALTTSGAAAPSDAGMARGPVTTALANIPQPQDTSAIDITLAEDTDWQAIQKSVLDILAPQNQKDTLLAEYDRLYENSGIEKLDAEIIDAETIIDGTEDDIRNEVQQAGGFATDSQVQAMAIGRNKSLIKRYNQLVAMKQSSQQRLDTMIQLSAKDREMAMQKTNQQLDVMFKMAEFKERASNNVKEGVQWLVTNSGWDGAYESLKMDPNRLAQTERILGMSPGGMAANAALARQQKERELLKDSLQIEGMRLSNTRTRQDIAKGGRSDTEIVDLGGKKVLINSFTGEILKEYEGTGTGPLNAPLVNPATGRVDPRNQISAVINSTGAKTDDKLKLTGAVVSAAQALAENSENGKFQGLGFGQGVPSFFASQKAQTNRTSLSGLAGTIESWMTGASVSEDQAKRIKKDLVPKAGDPDWVTRRKINALTNYMMNYAAGTLATQGVSWTPDTIDFFSPVTVTAPDGVEIEITN